MSLTPRQLVAFWLFVGSLAFGGAAIVAYEVNAAPLAVLLHCVAGAFVAASFIAAVIAIAAPGNVPEAGKLEAASKRGVLSVLKVMAGDRTDDK